MASLALSEKSQEDPLVARGIMVKSGPVQKECCCYSGDVSPPGSEGSVRLAQQQTPMFPRQLFLSA